MNEDFITKKLLEHDKRFDEHDEKFEELTSDVQSLRSEFKSFRSEMFQFQDEAITILKRLDTERLFTIERVKRLEDDVTTIKTHLHLA